MSDKLAVILVSAAQSVVVALIALIAFGWLVRHQPGRSASPLIALSAVSLLLTAPVWIWAVQHNHFFVKFSRCFHNFGHRINIGIRPHPDVLDIDN